MVAISFIAKPNQQTTQSFSYSTEFQHHPGCTNRSWNQLSAPSIGSSLRIFQALANRRGRARKCLATHSTTLPTVSNVAWKTKPSWFVVAGKDQAISPDEERFFARRMNATTTELNTSHVPMLSKPKEVAAAIMDAAAKATATKSLPGKPLAN